MLTRGGEDPNYWSERYRQDERYPYDLFLIKALLKASVGEENFLDYNDRYIDRLADDTTRVSTPTNFICIQGDLKISDSATAQLLSWVDEGNNLFISSSDMPDNFATALWVYCNDPFSSDTGKQAGIGLYNGDRGDSPNVLQLRNAYSFITMGWEYFDMSHYCLAGDSLTTPLGYILNERNTNFLSIRYGQGSVYLHTTPLAFTNYVLTQRAMLDYTRAVFDYLPESNIVWINSSLLVTEADDILEKEWERMDEPAESPLAIVLGSKTLRWAWYLLLSLLVLFVLVRLKRQQRIIPVLAPNTNTSLQFIHTIGRLYFETHNHTQLAQQKIKYFVAFVWQRYRIQVKPGEEGFIAPLAQKATYPEKELTQLNQAFSDVLRNRKMTSRELLNLHEKLEDFYQKSK